MDELKMKRSKVVMELDRKREVINICLDCFIEKGLTETSTRGLSTALKLQNAGMYHYFSSKDEAVILCAEEAALRLERALIPQAIADMDDLDFMMDRLKQNADRMAPTMQFLVSVCTSKRYKKDMQPVLERLARRYACYAQQVASKIDCRKEDIELYVYMMITAVSNYMIFSEDVFVRPQVEIAKDALERFAHSAGETEGGAVYED